MYFIEKKFGYYRVNIGNDRYLESSSKVEALELARTLNGWVTYHFNDECFSQFDWSNAIPESIDELYDARAMQIREKYDRVVLMYSGGYDSDNILKTFIRNNLKIDAIVYFYYGLVQHDPDHDLNLEWRLQTWPRLQNILPTIPHTELIRLDLSDLTLDIIDRHYEDYLYVSRCGLAPNNISRSYLRYKLPTIYRDSDSACIIYGIDKPRIRYQNSKFIFNFLDLVVGGTHGIIANSGIEYFYWSADSPKIVIKQAQIAKQYWQSNLEKLHSHTKNQKNQNLGIVLDHDYIPLQQLIYPQCQGHYHSVRPAVAMTGTRDVWLFNGNTDYSKKLQKIYQSYKNLPKEWFNGHDPHKGLIGHLSQDYIL